LPQQRKLRHLEKEILRKDKPLAEAAALLVLSKKALGQTAVDGVI